MPEKCKRYSVCGRWNPSAGAYIGSFVWRWFHVKGGSAAATVALFSQTVVHGDAVFYDDSITGSKCIISGAGIRVETRNLTYPWLALTVQFLMLVNTNCIVRSDVFISKKNKHGRKSRASSGKVDATRSRHS